MKNDKQALFSWLFDEVYQAKAALKYDIKQTEIRFQKEIMQNWQDTPLQKQSALEFCVALIKLYTELLAIFRANTAIDVTRMSCTYESDPMNCYLKIQQLRQNLFGTLSLQEEAVFISELLFLYKNLKSLLIEQLESGKDTYLPKSIYLKKLIQAATAEEWLLALVEFANEIKGDIICFQNQLANLTKQELLTLQQKLMKQEFIALNNSIFFFKINPGYLYTEAIHPEKLISIKARLKFLYNLIELLQFFSSQLLKQRGLQAEYDYLFHGDEISPGINIDVGSKERGLIVKALKSWRLNYANLRMDASESHLGEIFRAYKFWFNPVSLIDSIMNFYAKVTSNKTNIEEGKNLFLKQLNLIYHQLTTTECLDLYGYFSNKDTNYLMRTLLASYHGHELLSKSLSSLEKEAIFNVYTILYMVMDSLREELKSRYIVTKPYNHNIENKTLTPGRRNLQALQRVINIYCEQALVRTESIEQLFALLENEF
ncbi:Uncharacterised protein [Legionella busanensis]|uniref:Uncharacterized protein n=1 Tax=Legionella busanensis TaxID=190655 RepID=A0A378JI49_9GAMM|nr:hypothetical protein [Legionella busanensis]STX50348.1 Uncharacterised protein [Legionella busanensis]